MMLESGSDFKLAASVLRIAYAFVVTALAVLICGIVSLCSSSICFELMLLKNAFYITLYFASMCFLLIFFLHVYASSKKRPMPNTDTMMSTISSYQPHQMEPEQGKTSLKRPVGGQALPGLTAAVQNRQDLKAALGSESGVHIPTVLSSLRGRDRIWPIGLARETETPFQGTILTSKLAGFSASRLLDKLFVLPEITNVVLKLFVIALCLPSMLYAVFRMAVAIECVTKLSSTRLASPCLVAHIEIAQFAMLGLLIPMQAFHVFKYGRVFSRRSPLLSALALTHWLATNFATWFEMFTVETTRFRFRTATAVFDYLPFNSTTTSHWLSAASNSSLSSYSNCFDSSTTIRKASSAAAPFLFPLFTHFLLLVSISLLRLLFAVSAENSKSSDEDVMSADEIQLTAFDDGRASAITNYANDGPCDCRHSNKGIFFNLLVIVGLASLILAAHFLSPTEPFLSGSLSKSATVRLAYYTAQIAINSIVILSVPVAWRGLYRLDRVPHRDCSADPYRSVYQYNMARFAVTMTTLAFAIIYYLAIILAHSALLAQLITSYLNRDKTRKSGLQLAETSVIPYSAVTRGPLAARFQTPNGMFYFVCPDSQTNQPAVEAKEITFPAEILTMSPDKAIPAIVASALAIGRAVSSSLLAIAQVTFALLADCRSALTDKHLEQKPGRSLVMFILTASLIAWALEIAFELHTSSLGDSLATFHSFSLARFDIGLTLWPLFATFSVPFTVAFRLCIAVWLYDNWLKCYTPTVI